MEKENFYQRNIKPQLKKGMDEIRHPGNHPKTTALSIAIGLFIGIAIPMGFQVWAMAALLLIFHYNLVIASFVSLISNPFTILPIYYVILSLGEFILGVNFPWELFYNFLEEPGMDKILAFGTRGISVFFTGSIVIAVLVAVPSYFIAIKAITRMHDRKNLISEKV